MDTSATGLLDVRDLSVAVRSRRGPIGLVDRVSLSIGRGEIVGLVGESGCGKSMTAAAIGRLFPTTAARITGGEVMLEGTGDLTNLSDRQFRKIRGARIGMIFQDPSTYLDPLMTIGRQVGEALQAHGYEGSREDRVAELLAMMGLPDAAQLSTRYPHELSGGQRQRVLIAAALAGEPDLLIADEPSTALDVTVQAEILVLLRELRDDLGLSILMITHDLGVVAQMCDRVYVMYAGRVVEERDVYEIFKDPRHPYTLGLLAGTLSPEVRDQELFAIPGRVPDPRAMPEGCRFHPRCPLAVQECREKEPPKQPLGEGFSACWKYDDPRLPRAWQLAEEHVLPVGFEGIPATSDDEVSEP
ncbi:ABC transporter ATP-binding protein [Pseudactinotalea terrae]|uniref:ABC transporter ATP-binding protein n=1 Tax=Pseudactinotalea terrae TaxID=1743262 RepID=UPI0012E207F6|nr:ABC transporter ATP-binding protein [Pseudactinotalea terrae]